MLDRTFVCLIFICLAWLFVAFALNDHLTVCSLQHDSLSHMLGMTLIVWYSSASHDCLLHDNPFSCMFVWSLVFVHYLTLDLRFCRMHPHPSLCTLDYPWVLRDGRAFTIKKPLGNARKCMCGGDDHLAWKHPISLEACRGLRTAGGYNRFC